MDWVIGSSCPRTNSECGSLREARSSDVQSILTRKNNIISHRYFLSLSKYYLTLHETIWNVLKWSSEKYLLAEALTLESFHIENQFFAAYYITCIQAAAEESIIPNDY